MAKYYRTIAARGITPEYRGKDFGEKGLIYGRLIYFEHYGHSTLVGVEEPNEPAVVEYDFEHLDLVDVYA